MEGSSEHRTSNISAKNVGKTSPPFGRGELSNWLLQYCEAICYVLHVANVFNN